MTLVPILDVTKTDALLVDADNNGVPSPGDTLLYQVDIVNNGSSTATGVVFNDTPGANTALVSGSVLATPGTVVNGNGPADTTVAVDIGSIPAGSGAQISFRVLIVNPLPAGVTQVANQGTVRSDQLPTVSTDDPSTLPAGDPTETSVTAAPALNATKTAILAVDADNNGVPSPGDTLLYQVAIVNSGNTAATGITFADTPGANTTLVVGTVQTNIGFVTGGNGAGDTSIGVTIVTLAGGTATRNQVPRARRQPAAELA